MRIEISKDKDFVKEMRRAIKDNDGYCPCSVVKSNDTKCICKEFLNMEHGTCHCGLYTKYPD